MKNKVIYSFSILILIFAMICSLLLVGNGPIVALAESTVSDVVWIGDHEYRNLNITTIEDDLTGATIDGKPFNFEDYPADPNGAVKFLSLVEFGYIANNSDYFELFVYVYNPTGNPISTITGTSSQNKMSICVERDSFGEAKSYEKFVLSYIDRTEDNLFYKFCVVMQDDKLFNSLNPTSRRYDIAEIELLSLGNNAISSSVGYRYIYSGYQQGCDSSSKDGSTLQCAVTKDLEVLELDVFHTVYRTNSSDNGAYYKNQINSCWFAIPNEVYNQYENIDYIKAEWWEYYTKLAFVSSNQDAVNSILEATKVIVPAGSHDDKYYALRSGFTDLSNPLLPEQSLQHWEWGFNVKPVNETVGSYVTQRLYDKIENFIPISIYDDDLNVDSKTMSDYLTSYSNDLGNGSIDCNGRNLSTDLFEDYVSEGHNRGQNIKEVKFGDTFDLISYADSHGSWERFLDYGWTQPLNEESLEGLERIKIVDDDDFTFETISEDLLIGPAEVQSFYDFYVAHKNTHKVILLRFGVTNDYFSRNVEVFDYLENTYNYSQTLTYSAFVSQETVYLDFSIIQINFMKNGKSIAIPVANSPKDSVGGLEKPEDESIKNTINNAKDDIDDALSGLLDEIETWFDKLKQDIVNFFSEIWSVAKLVLIVVAGLFVIYVVVFLLTRLFPRRVKIKFKQPKQSKRSVKRKYVKPPKV